MRNCLSITASLLILTCLLTTALAQTTDPPPPEGEPPTGEELVLPVPTVKYIVASPRACLLPSITAEGEWVARRPAVFNFPRRDGAIKVPVGTNVLVALSRQTEGVWYPDSTGMMHTSLELELLNPNADPCDPCVPTWIPLGRDAARDFRRGPSIGTARVAVRAKFRQPGHRVLRATIRSAAQSYPPLDDTTGEPTVEPPAPVVAVDRVRIHVIAVDTLPDEITQDDFTPNPDAFFTRPMHKPIDPDDEDLEADVNADNAVDLFDLSLLASQWGQRIPSTPLDDDIE